MGLVEKKPNKRKNKVSPPAPSRPVGSCTERKKNMYYTTYVCVVRQRYRPHRHTEARGGSIVSKTVGQRTPTDAAIELPKRHREPPGRLPCFLPCSPVQVHSGGFEWREKDTDTRAEREREREPWPTLDVYVGGGLINRWQDRLGRRPPGQQKRFLCSRLSSCGERETEWDGGSGYGASEHCDVCVSVGCCVKTYLTDASSAFPLSPSPRR